VTLETACADSLRLARGMRKSLCSFDWNTHDRPRSSKQPETAAQRSVFWDGLCCGASSLAFSVRSAALIVGTKLGSLTETSRERH
jgi:hypothetical protein